MTHEDLNQIEANLRKVEKLLPGDYGLTTALELAAELRKLLPTSEAQEAAGEAQSQSVALGAPA